MISNEPSNQLSEAECIRIAYPSEPEWKTLSDTTLVELVREFWMEPSCAGLALNQLANRRHPMAEELCNYLLQAEDSDQWLRAGALDKLMFLNPLDGLNKAMALLENDCYGVLEEVIVVLNYEHQGPLSDEIHRHPIVPMVKRRIAQRGADSVDFSDKFAANFGAE